MSSRALNWDAPRYETVEACAAVHCNSQWLTNLINGPPSTYELSADQVVERVRKRKFVFTFRTIFHLAMIRRLGAVMTLASARDLSRVCVDADHLWPADLGQLAPPRYLLITPATGESRVLDDQDVAGFTPALANGMAARSPTILFNVTPVFDQVVKGLGL
jgi:hypothetical protein